LKHIGIIYLFFFAILNLFLNCHFQLHYDESYYWAFSQNLDWSYYDHPPMISLLIRISNIFFNNELSIRFVSCVTTTITCFTIYKLAKFLFNKDIANMSLILILSLPIIQGIYFVATPDSPLFMFSSLSLYFFARWLFSEKNNAWYCLLSALFIGFALLSKYTAILLLISFVLFLLISKKYRYLLLSKSFLFSIPLVITIFMPVLIWNYNHDWVSFKFQFHHGVDLNQKLNLACLLDYIGSQIGITGIIMLPIIIIFMIKNFKLVIKNDKLLFLLVPFLFILTFFGSRSLFQYMEGNWPGISYLSAVVLFAYIINQWQLKWVIKYYIILISFIFIICKFPLYFYPAKFRNVSQFAIINNFYGNKELIDSFKKYTDNNNIILACDYGNASEFWFYTNYRTYVLDDFKFANQYKFWNSSLNLENKNIYYLCNNNDIDAMNHLKKYFNNIELLDINSYNNKVGSKKMYFYKVSNSKEL
jgi:4-amino-4-deoxy-L-arabinose transferase-like glycosyltransferase